MPPYLDFVHRVRLIFFILSPPVAPDWVQLDHVTNCYHVLWFTFLYRYAKCLESLPIVTSPTQWDRAEIEIEGVITGF